jgi:hypothetical protein
MEFFRHTGLARQERTSRWALSDALQTARNRQCVKGLQVLDQPEAKFLYAVNGFARIKWGKALCDEFERHFDLLRRSYPSQPLFWITLVDVECRTSPGQLLSDVDVFRRRLTGSLRGLSYIGMIEPAYYVNICSGTNCSLKRGIFWHFHAICWGESGAQMKTRFDAINRRPDYLYPIAPGLDAADWRPIPDRLLADGSRTYLQDKSRYMLKSPQKAYRIYQIKNSDGQSVGFQQKKDKLRPGERITLFNVMQSLFLDRMAAGGGEGTEILRRAKRVALAQLRDQD